MTISHDINLAQQRFPVTSEFNPEILYFAPPIINNHQCPATNYIARNPYS